MKTSTACWASLTLLTFGTLAGCTGTTTKPADVSDSRNSADVSANVRRSLDQAGFKGVTATHDRGMGVVTLAGEVELDREKSEAESIARSSSGGQAVSNHIAVMPMGAGHMGDHGRGRVGEQGTGHMGDRGRGRVPEPKR